VFYQSAHPADDPGTARGRKFGKNYLTFGAFGMLLTGNYGAKYATPFDQYDPSVRFYQRTKSYAFFAQDEFKFDDHWKLIVGARYWHDSKLGWYNGVERSRACRSTMARAEWASMIPPALPMPPTSPPPLRRPVPASTA
jgi:iron complex outermembrane receptor protein